jgi:hypothetical protein
VPAARVLHRHGEADAFVRLGVGSVALPSNALGRLPDALAHRRAIDLLAHGGPERELVRVDGVAQPYLERVEAELLSGHVDKLLLRPDHLGDAEAAKRAGRRGVGVHDVRVDPDVRDRIGQHSDVRADVHHLVSPQRRGAAVVDDVVPVSGDDSLAVEHQLRVPDLTGAGGAGQEDVGPAEHDLHRSAQPHRHHCGDHLVGEHLGLGPETGAHVRDDHPHPRARDLQRIGQSVAHHERRLRRRVDGEHSGERVVARHAAVRIECHRRLAVRAKPLSHDDCGGRFRLARVADADPVAVEDVAGAELVADALLDQRRVGGDRGFRVGQHGQPFVGDADRLDRVLGLVAGVGDDRGDLLPLEDDLVRRQREVIADQQVLHQVAPGLDAAHDVAGGQRRVHAGHGGGIGHIDIDQAGVRPVAAQDPAVQHARQPDIVDEPGRAGEKSQILLPRNGLADELLLRRSRPSCRVSHRLLTT